MPDKVSSFLKSQQFQATLRALLAPSGVVGVKLIEWGFPGTQLGPVTELLVQVAPFVAALAWSLAVKTHKAIIAQAAKILADRQQGAIIINPEAATPGAVKAVADPSLTNVVATGTPEAIKVATEGPG